MNSAAQRRPLDLPAWWSWRYVLTDREFLRLASIVVFGAYVWTVVGAVALPPTWLLGDILVPVRYAYFLAILLAAVFAGRDILNAIFQRELESGIFTLLLRGGFVAAVVWNLGFAQERLTGPAFYSLYEKLTLQDKVAILAGFALAYTYVLTAHWIHTRSRVMA